MTTLELRGVTLAELLNRIAGKQFERDIVLTTTLDGKNVLHWGDECRHGTHLSRPCFQCERGVS